jgi:hypothetical protein
MRRTMHFNASNGYLMLQYGTETCSFVIWWHLVVNVADQRYPHLGCVVASEDVTDEVRLDLHMHLCETLVALTDKQSPFWKTYHLQCTPQHAHQYVGEPKLILRTAIVGKLDEVCEGILFEYEGELLVVARPICNRGRDIEEYLEADLMPWVSLEPLPLRRWGTFEIISATSRKLVQAGTLVLARKSSINRTPMLYPMRSNCLLTLA